ATVRPAALTPDEYVIHAADEPNDRLATLGMVAGALLIAGVVGAAGYIIYDINRPLPAPAVAQAPEEEFPIVQPPPPADETIIASVPATPEPTPAPTLEIVTLDPPELPPPTPAFVAQVRARQTERQREAEAFKDQGNDLIARGDYVEARRFYEQAVQADPQF